MTDEQRTLLEDKFVIWTRQSCHGPMEMRDYNLRAAEALKACLAAASQTSPSPSGDLREAVARKVRGAIRACVEAGSYPERAAEACADQIAALYAAHGFGLSRDPSHTHNAAMSASPSTGQGEG